MKFLIQAPKDLIAKVTEKAQGMGLTRTAYIRMVLIESLKEEEK